MDKTFGLNKIQSIMCSAKEKSKKPTYHSRLTEKKVNQRHNQH
jgi:hypothetical protein